MFQNSERFQELNTLHLDRWIMIVQTMHQLSLELESFKVGDHVVAIRSMVDGPSDCSPGGIFCHKGEVLEIRKINPEYKTHPLTVRHLTSIQHGFGASLDEVIPYTEGAEKFYSEQHKQDVATYNYLYGSHSLFDY